MKVLMLGCGRSKIRKIQFPDGPKDFSGDELITIDIDAGADPTILMDLNEIYENGLPFNDGEFDEIHAYDFLEHIGKQGDWRGFFDEFGEYHRILKDGGRMYAIVPSGGDNFADPGHVRFFSQNHFLFLCQWFYDHEREKGTSATDYRWYWQKDFAIIDMQVKEGHHIAAVLEKK